MLYHVYEMQRVGLAPLRMAANSALSLMDLPFNPIRDTPFGRLSVAALDSFEHSTRAFGKPAWNLPTTEIDGKKVAVCEDVVVRKPWCNLLHFRRDVQRASDCKVLMVAPMSGHFATLLRGTVQAFLPDHDVYITDWRDAREMSVIGPGFDLDDYVDYVQAFIRHLGPDCHVVAVCQPAVPVLAAVALMSADAPHESPLSMTLIGGPIDTRKGPTAVNAFAKSRNLDWFRRHVIHRVPPGNMGCMRQVYPGFLQLAGFMAMNLDRHMEAHWDMFQHLVQGDGEPLAAKRAFYEEYRAVMDLPAEYYLQTIEKVFQEHSLPRGLFLHRGRLVEPTAVTTTALLTVEGERDDISGIGQTRAAHALTPNLVPERHAHWEQPGVGHYGLFNGRRFNVDVAPRIKAFMAEHS